jgi:flagellar operon protein
MNISNNNFSSIEQMTGQLLSNKPKIIQKPVSNGSATFDDILKSKEQLNSVNELRFSKHANERLASRNIDLSKEQLERLENGTSMARQKGIQESLVMVDDLAFIVNIKNNVVVTAVKDTEDSVFTNIDGAVIS